MPINDGAQTIHADEKQTVTVVDHEAHDSQSKERSGKHLSAGRKRPFVISAAMLVAIVGGYFAWNSFRYEDTDDAQVDGHVMRCQHHRRGNSFPRLPSLPSTRTI